MVSVNYKLSFSPQNRLLCRFCQECSSFKVPQVVRHFPHVDLLCVKGQKLNHATKVNGFFFKIRFKGSTVINWLIRMAYVMIQTTQQNAARSFTLNYSG